MIFFASATEQVNGLSMKHGMPASRNGLARSKWTVPSTDSISMPSTLPIMSAGFSTSGTPNFFICSVKPSIRSGDSFDSPGQPMTTFAPSTNCSLGVPESGSGAW